MRITIVTPVVVHEHCRIKEIARGLEAQLHPEDQWIVCADGSHPEAEAVTRGKALYIQGPETHQNGNAQRELGMRHATGDFIWFLDDSILPMPDALDQIRVISEPRPHLFRMMFVPYPELLKWRKKEWHLGSHDVVAAGLVTPNHQDKLGSWHLADHLDDVPSPYGYPAPRGHEWQRAGGYFVDSTVRNYPEGPIWRPEYLGVWFE